ncbi:glycosyltransferase family 4 protein [Paenibacillus sp. SI8]|uniref:glycosyltransferase family 4 protein n=1 Tax=unclassified Paenibacillus TaxID=185978 RepID=UPI003466208E
MSTPRRPRALLFSHICNPDHITGAEKMLLFTTLELGRQYDCTLVVPREGLLAAEARRHGIKTMIQSFPLLYEMYKPEPALLSMFEALLENPAYRSLLDLLLIQEPDVVITNTCVNMLPAAAAKKLGIPVIWIIAETIEQNESTSLSVRLVDQYADWIVGISHATLQPFQMIGSDHKKYTLPPSWRTEEYDANQWSASRQNRRAELGVHGDQPVIGYISSDIYANKGLDHFIQMAVSICYKNHDAHFMIAGKPVDPVYMESCVQMILLSGYSSQFTFLSFAQDIQSLYPAMDVVVVPSLLNEGFGLTAFEGLIFGKPVVAYRSGGLNEILTTTGNSAFLANKGDIQDLTAKVEGLIVDNRLRQEVGERNSQSIRKVFGIDAYRSRLGYFVAQLGPRLAARASAMQSAARQPDGLLLKGGTSNAVFLLEQGKKRPFHSMEDFHFYKFNWHRVSVVPEEKLMPHPTGEAIRAAEPFLKYAPAIFVAKATGTTVYLLQHGIRYPFQSEVALKRYGYELTQVVALTESALAAYSLGQPIAELGNHSEKKPLRKRKGKLIGIRKRKKGIKLRRAKRGTGKPNFKRKPAWKAASRKKLRKGKTRKAGRAAYAARKKKKKSSVKAA